MTQKPKISVIIPVYKAEMYFERCLISLFKQTLSGIEYIFINDNTPDKSFTILENTLLNYPERKDLVKIQHNQKNLGSGASRNIGLSKAEGEYIIFCDSDDWCDLDLYEKMYNTAIESNADIVCCNIWHEYSTNRFCEKYDYKSETIDSLLDLKFDLLYSSLWNKLIRKDLYLKNGIFFFDGINKWEDVGVVTRLRYYSKCTIVIKDSYYHYNKLNSQSITSVHSVKKVEEQMKCASLLDDFFRDKGESFLIIRNYLKFISKSDLFVVRSIRDLNRWRSTFEETNEMIWKYKVLSMNTKLIFWLASKGYFNAACFLNDLKQLLYKLKYK